ncbi:MAG TPA: dienelactone hydrolase family protein, partial [Blastocatellia bacterium]|nr:dienelactone hydrolase family protein [Blastocatellia bacterium]
AGFADMTDAYFLSPNRQSDIEVYNGLGVGTWMLSMFRQKFPNEKPLHQTIGDWVADHILSTGSLAEVSFQTADGWTIYGNLRVPQNAAGKLPAVILLHSGLSDRHAYHELEAELARAGLVVLNIDWRGRGKSTGKGKYFELTKAERDKGHLDALAAVNFLAAQPNVDAARIGILGTVIGARYAMAAAAEDPRIRTAVVLTGYIPTEKERAYFTSQNVPVLYITSRGHRAVTQALTDFHKLTRERGSELMVYDGGAIGYQLFELDESLLPRVVRWMKEKLSQ